MQCDIYSVVPAGMCTVHFRSHIALKVMPLEAPQVQQVEIDYACGWCLEVAADLDVIGAEKKGGFAWVC